MLKREGIDVDVASVEVPDVETAMTLRFLGSPSVRVDRTNIEPGRENDPSFFGGRTGSVDGKTSGLPPEDWLVEAIRKALPA